MSIPPPFEVRGHTADLRLYVSGKTKQELFRNALRGMSSVIKHAGGEEEHPSTGSGSRAEPMDREWTVQREVVAESIDLAALLVDFLNGVLYLTDTNGEVFRDVKFYEFSDTGLEAELFGEQADELDEDIKAVTHHELEIIQRPDGYYEATIIFDI